MIVYRLTTPLDEFDDLVALSAWLRTAIPESTAWLLKAVLALADAAASAGWRGDMAHLPTIAAGTDGEPVLVVKQDDNGTTFLISAHPQPGLAEQYGGARAIEVPARPIDPFGPPTAAEIAEAMWGGDGGPRPHPLARRRPPDRAEPRRSRHGRCPAGGGVASPGSRAIEGAKHGGTQPRAYKDAISVPLDNMGDDLLKHSSPAR